MVLVPVCSQFHMQWFSWVCMKGLSGVSRVAVPSWPSFDSRNCFWTSVFHISHDFCSGKSWIGHLRMLLEVSVWVPVNSRKLGRIVVPSALDISDSQVICRKSRHWLILWMAMGFFSIFISSPMMLWSFSHSGWVRKSWDYNIQLTFRKELANCCDHWVVDVW
jgi:hypothetical protein